VKRGTPMKRTAWPRRAGTQFPAKNIPEIIPAARAGLAAPSRPTRAVAPTVISTTALAQPKTAPHRNRRLLDLARGQPCLLRVPGVCQGGTETTVAAHSNLSIHGKGGARKADDIYSVFSCGTCHAWLDQGRAPRTAKEAAFMLGHLRQVEQWRLMATNVGTSAADRAAAQWALDLLGATPVFSLPWDDITPT